MPTALLMPTPWTTRNTEHLLLSRRAKRLDGLKLDIPRSGEQTSDDHPSALMLHRQYSSHQVPYHPNRTSSPSAGKKTNIERNALALGSMSTASTSSVSRSRRIGPYRVIKPLGRGASGSVFLVVHQDLGEQAAIKVMAPDNDPAFDNARSSEKGTRLARFVREGRTLAELSRLQHPGIVRVFDCRRNKAKTRAYLVMEYIDGASLREWLALRSRADGRSPPSPVPVGTALDIATQLAEALSLVHERGIVHRDVKPENIIVRSSSGVAPASSTTTTEKVTLVDFGIAKITPRLTQASLAGGTDHSLTTISTREGTILGTVGYMAPEQCLGQQATDRADVYALGVILFELLSGEPPFKAESAVELLIQHVQQDPPALGEFAAQRGVSVPRWLSSLVSSMLEKAPEQRPRMAEALATLRTPPTAESCPLPGLTALNAANADLLIGRSLDAALVTRWVNDALSTYADGRGHAASAPSRWIVIEGSAGAGKTSFLQAGIVPLLSSRQSGPNVDIAMLDATASSIGEWLVGHVKGSAHATVVCVDQVERILAGAEGVVTRWADSLAQMLSSPEAVVAVTLVRRDALARLTGLPALRSFAPNVCSLTSLTSAMLGEAVSTACRRGHIRLGEGLRDRIVRDATAASVPLSFVHLFLQLLWRRRGAVSLSLTEYEQLLGSTGLVRFASESFESDLGGLSSTELDCARSIILALVWPGRGLPDTPRARSRADLLCAAGLSPEAEATLRHLCGEGVRPLSGPPLLLASAEGGSPVLTLVHDAVLTEVPVIAGWVATERPGLEYLAHVEELAGDWERAGRPADDLPQGTLLTYYTRQRGLLERMGTVRAKQFIAAAHTTERRQRARTRWLRITLMAAALAILTSAGLAWRERGKAISNARQAAVARDRANTHLRQVLGSVEQIATDTDWDLAVQPDPTGSLFAVRRRLLESAETRLQDIEPVDLQQPGVRVARIRVRQRLADLAYLQIKLSVAQRWLELAQQDISAGLRGASDRDELAELDALYWSKLGKVALARGQQNEAIAAFKTSLDTFTRLRVAQDGRSALNQGNFLLSIATSSLELGLARLQRAASAGDEQAGVQLLHEAVALFGQAGAMPYAQGLAADAKLHLCEQALRAGHLSEAEVFLADAGARLDVLHRDAPTHMGWRSSLIRTGWLRGRLLAARKQTSAAGAVLAAAVDAGRQFLADQPREWRHRGQLITTSRAMIELSDLFGHNQEPDGRAMREELCRLISPAAAADPEYTQLISIRNYACSDKCSLIR